MDQPQATGNTTFRWKGFCLENVCILLWAIVLIVLAKVSAFESGLPVCHVVPYHWSRLRVNDNGSKDKLLQHTLHEHLERSATHFSILKYFGKYYPGIAWEWTPPLIHITITPHSYQKHSKIRQKYLSVKYFKALRTEYRKCLTLPFIPYSTLIVPKSP